MRGLRVPRGLPFVLPYLPFLIVFGVAPTVYALDLAFTNAAGGWVGFHNFVRTYDDFRFAPAFRHILVYTIVWLGALMVFVVGLVLLLHGRGRTSSTFRFLFYMPGALAGAAAVVIWLFMLDPTVSPASFLLSDVLGAHIFAQSIAPGNLPYIFAMIAFWTGAGGWIVVMYGALKTIPPDLEEAARIDGAGPFTIAFRLKLPLIRKWIAYMLILSFATDAALRRTSARATGELRSRLRHLVGKPARLPARVPVRGLQRGRRHRRRPAHDRARRRGTYRHTLRPLQNGRLMRIPLLTLRLAVLALFAVFFIAPVLWLILAPTKSDAALITSSPFSFGSFRNVWRAWQHLDGFSSHIYRRWIANSLIYSLSATAITLAISIPAGYGLALGKFPGRKLILTLTLVVMIMPCVARAPDLPRAERPASDRQRLLGDPAVLVLPVRGLPRLHLLRNVDPVQLLDAARVDGCGEWLTFRRVALPLAKPVLALVFFFSFVANWNNFFLPYVVLANSNQYPITVGLSDLLASTPSFNPAAGGGGQLLNIFKPELALATLIAVIPVAIVFLVSQRALVRGTLGGAVKQ